MPKVPTQQPVHACDCGQPAPVTPTDSPREFTWVCPCGRTGLISWAHKADPPRWEGVPYAETAENAASQPD
jgi:hypothetical protein